MIPRLHFENHLSTYVGLPQNTAEVWKAAGHCVQLYQIVHVHKYQLLGLERPCPGENEVPGILFSLLISDQGTVLKTNYKNEFTK